ncbi:Urea carboxylase-related aminomethyltransferase [Cronobacter condimenti 1330]|uniref:Urea carboxylase n=1 Tax=Cronobacter condimenti 1330 TaxID=1073999 RepID=K8AFC3_9ENTR|nr:urea amidolyase associated protein UAAP1 [Cronobacter condimenti]ALB64521.1 urea carboxylase [Cronobacter condimenti 1330]CCJ74489.1 Urea carboxylase-related aminomethyltransferase [Cronobacter condimenti 1330]
METVYETRLPAGSHWSLVMRRGTALTLTDIAGGVNAAALFYNPENPLERYNAPDTLKCQHTFRLTEGHCLYSDMGRIFCGIEQDTFGWHETVCGSGNAALTEQQFGVRRYQHAHNERHQNGVDSFLTELAKYGLGKRDMAANVNFFARVETGDDGALALTAQGLPGASVRLRFAMDTLVVLHTCPHPLSESTTYPTAPLGLTVDGTRQPLPASCLARAENQRGLRNNHLYYLSEGV